MSVYWVRSFRPRRGAILKLNTTWSKEGSLPLYLQSIPIPKMAPKLTCHLVNKGKETGPCLRFWLDRASYNLLHLRYLDGKVDFELGCTYWIDVLSPKNKWTRIKVRISYLNEAKHRLGWRIIACPGYFKQQMGQLLFDHLDLTPKQLYKMQFPIDSVKSGVHFKTACTAKELEDVLHLRSRAYQMAGKISATNHPTLDEFDKRSIIVLAKHHNKVVGSLRLIISRKNQRLEHEYSLILPRNFPRKENTIEITRVCTHPDYRHGDLLEGLFQYTSFVAMAHGRSWILGSSTDELLPLYQKMGFRKSCIRFHHIGLGQIEHTLFLANKDDIVRGRWVHPLLWYILYRDVYFYAKQIGFLPKFSISDHIRIFAYYGIGIAVAAFRKFRKRKWIAKFTLQEF